MFAALYFVLIEGRPAGEVDQEVEEAVHPVDHQHQAGDHEARQAEGAVGGGQVRPPDSEEARPHRQGQPQEEPERRGGVGGGEDEQEDGGPEKGVPI